jgi:glycosyltransferase involved in cell wall biosynthesis
MSLTNTDNPQYMKIVIFTHYFYPHVGGIESVVENHAKRLADRGHDITIVTSDIDSDSRKDSRDGYTVVRYSAANFLEHLGIPYPIPNPVDCARVTGTVVDDDTDILHVHGLNYLTSVLPVLTLKSREIPTLLHQHTPFVDYSPIVNSVEYLNDAIVGRLVLNQADCCIAVSQNITGYLEELGADQVDVLYNGVDVDMFSPNIAETLDEVLYVGRLTQKKGIERLLQTVKILEIHGHDNTVRVVGKGDLSKKVRSAASSSEILEFEGFVEFERLPQLYSQASALIVPDQTGDALPTLTILEALASGTPPILVQDNQLPDLFIENKNYIKSQPKPECLANAIQRLSRSPELRETTARHSRKTAEESFDWESHVDKLEILYQNV